MAFDNEVRPFKVAIPEADLVDLRERLGRTRWPDQLPNAGWAYGVPLRYLKDLVEFWRTSYDWRQQEARLNRWPQFTTTIDGTNVHFIHVRSPEPDALPLMMTHGWPGSIVEFLDIIGPLTDPRAHGGDPADAFHLVCPSIPGFGFSGPTPEKGWHVRRIAAALGTLMQRLGYERFGAQGGDWGSAIARHLAVLEPERLLGIHVTLVTPPPKNPDEMSDLNDAEKKKVERVSQWMTEQSGYGWIQGSRPQTLAYGLADSPAGQLAWIVEKFKEWTDSRDVPEDAVARDDILTNVMLYWLTNTAGSSARIYYETSHAGLGWGSEVTATTVPMGVAVFPKDAPAIRKLAVRTNNKIVQWSEFDRGGHFAALEQPDLLVHNVRRFFRWFR
ncbi:MAG TPA: epoxide hydrolase [Polyangia bacterium]|nr:epoxide hydrolase [Polyangia bacterium]